MFLKGFIVGVDSNGEDGIGLTIATMKDNELHILGSYYGDNARFIDLLIKENQELKKLIVEKTKIGLASNHYASKCEGKVIVLETKQKEFIEYLEDLLTIKKQKANTVRAYQRTVIPIQEILINFKKIIGVYDENTKD